MKKMMAAMAAVMMCLTGMSVSAAGYHSSTGGTAVFDFGDNAFFSVKMQENESIYLDLDSSYQKELAQQVWEQLGEEADRFYRFDAGEQEFLRTGELFLAAEKGQSVYEILADGSLCELAAEYAEGCIVGKDGKRAGGFVFPVKALGSYVIVG